MKNKSLFVRMSFAVAGLAEAWQRERSFRTEVVLGVVAIVVTTALKPGLIWAAAVALSISLVLALELVNAAFEGLVDHLHPGAAPEIKVVKDIAAGAVLVAASGAVVVGLMMLLAIVG